MRRRQNTVPAMLILFELRLLLSGHEMYKFVDNQSVGNTINNSISRPSDERTVALCGPTRPGASSPPRYIYLSGSDDAIEQWTGGRGDGIAEGSEEQRERIDRASRSGGATRRVSTDGLMGKNETLQLRFSG